MSEKTNKNENICHICNNNVSKYSCPRCYAPYCSLDCYKSEKHAECSESFYRECVNEELSSLQTDDESKRRMLDILKKMHNQQFDEQQQIEELLKHLENVDDIDSDTIDDEAIGDEIIDSDDDHELDLHDRLKDLDLNDADTLWKALTDDEKNEFEALLNQGDVGSIMPQWEAWWTYSKEEKLVEVVTNKDKMKEQEELKKCPLLKEVQKLDSLTTVKPSPAIKFNITNVLASYAFVMRYFNGELEPVEWTTYFLNICGNLNTNTNFEDPAMAVESVVQKCHQSELIQTDEVSLDVMKRDTYSILQGPSRENKTYYCKAALSHIHRIFNEAKIAAKIPKTKVENDKHTKKNKDTKDKNAFSKKFPEHTSSYLPTLDVSKLKKCIKKVEYYLSFVESNGMEFE